MSEPTPSLATLVLKAATTLCSGCKYNYPKINGEHDDHGERDMCYVPPEFDAAVRAARRELDAAKQI